MRGEIWTDEKLDLLKQLWAGGATAQVIADRLGISRSAVMGKIFRLRLEPSKALPPSAIQGAAAPHGSGKKRRREARPAAAESTNSPARRRRGKRQDAAQAAIKTNARGKSLLELTNDSCRWPHGRPGTARFFFCGVAGADLERGMPYCARHARRAYLAEPTMSEKPKRWRGRVGSPPLVPDQVDTGDRRFGHSSIAS